MKDGNALRIDPTLGMSQNIVASNGERIGLISVLTTGTITVTNSPPADPTGFSTNLTDSTVSLSWNNNSESDLSHYNLYKSSTQGFTPDSTNLLVQINQPGSTYTDTVSIGAAKHRWVL